MLHCYKQNGWQLVMLYHPIYVCQSRRLGPMFRHHVVCMYELAFPQGIGYVGKSCVNLKIQLSNTKLVCVNRKGPNVAVPLRNQTRACKCYTIIRPGLFTQDSPQAPKKISRKILHKFKNPTFKHQTSMCQQKRP